MSMRVMVSSYDYCSSIIDGSFCIANLLTDTVTISGASPRVTEIGTSILLLTCTFETAGSAGSSLVLAWSKDGTQRASQSGTGTSTITSILAITNVMGSDLGVYICALETHSASVTVIGMHACMHAFCHINGHCMSLL